MSAPVVVSADKLPVSCPPAKQWDKHPRVYLPLSVDNPRQSCPYCGTVYVLQSAAAVRS